MFLFILRNKSCTAKSLFHRTVTKFAERGLSSNRNENHYDIIITGGGMIGTTLACTLGKNPRLSSKHILLLEAGKEKVWALPEKYSNRVVSVNPGTYNLLNDIGAWKHIEDARYASVKRLQVWDAVSDASITFGQEENTENVSYIVENDLLIAAVNKEVKNVDKVKIQYNTRVKNYHLPEYNEEGSQITLDNGETYTCELLDTYMNSSINTKFRLAVTLRYLASGISYKMSRITIGNFVSEMCNAVGTALMDEYLKLGCDGVNSQVRKAMKVNYLNWNYHQTGVVATLKLSENISNTIAWQRFLPTGPIAFLPLTDNLSSLVWSTTPENAKELLEMPEDQFADAVNSAIWKNYEKSNIVDQATKTFDSILRLMNCSSDTVRQFPPKIAAIEEGSRAAFPLGFGHSLNYIGKGVALVGDAAHRIHPLAGQGVNLGFGDITCLNRVLGNAIHSGSKLDNLSYLKEYETERQRHNIPTMLAVEGLHRLYNSDFTPLVLLRSLGLQATHALSPVKKAIINQAAI